MQPTLNPALREFWSTTTHPTDNCPVRFRTLHGGRMSSKCLGIGTPVLMYDGTIKPVELVVVGDKLMGPDSKPRTVLNTVRGFDDLYNVKQSSAMDYIVNSNHVLSVRKTPSAMKDILNINIEEYLHKITNAEFKKSYKGWRIDSECGYKLSTVTVSPAGYGEYAGFEVDGDHLFCLGDGTVTHNSHDAAGVAIARANHHTERFLCTRMFQNRISDSVYTLLKDKIDYFGLSDRFKVYADAIEHRYNGSLFRFYGMARNIDEIKSFEGATVCWIEEAHNLTEEMFNTIRPTVMRNEGAEMWFTFNPKYATDFSWRRLVVNPPAGTLVRQINFNENMFLSPTAVADIKSAYEEDYDLAVHTYEGIPYDDDDNVIIKRSWVLAAYDAHKIITPESGIWTGARTVGFDVADSGDDKCATTTTNGSIITGVDEWSAGVDELYESTERVLKVAKSINASSIGYDSIGVGAGTGSALNKMGWRKHYKFNAGAKVCDPERYYDRAAKIYNQDHFENLKAQAWWAVADRFRNTYNAVKRGKAYNASDMISIDTSTINPKLLVKLTEELATPNRDFSRNGKIMVESKKDLAKRDVPSPNIADSTIISLARGMLAKRSITEML